MDGPVSDRTGWGLHGFLLMAWHGMARHKYNSGIAVEMDTREDGEPFSFLKNQQGHRWFCYISILVARQRAHKLFQLRASVADTTVRTDRQQNSAHFGLLYSACHPYLEMVPYDARDVCFVTTFVLFQTAQTPICTRHQSNSQRTGCVAPDHAH